MKKNVSRETTERLITFYDLLIKWNPKINLVSKSSIENLWERHIWDSAQIVELAEDEPNWVDIGSGGGLPGLIISIYAKQDLPSRRVTLVESDQRKSAFLRTVIRELELNAEVVVKRIEAIDPLHADILSARALADLDALLEFAERHLSTTGTAFFMKGEKWEKEVAAAHESWSFDLKAHTSKTSAKAAILEIKEIKRV